MLWKPRMARAGARDWPTRQISLASMFPLLPTNTVPQSRLKGPFQDAVHHFAGIKELLGQRSGEPALVFIVCGDEVEIVSRFRLVSEAEQASGVGQETART